MKKRPVEWDLILGRWLLVTAFLALWEFSSGRLIDEFYLSRPSAIAVRLVQMFVSGEVWFHGSITFYEAFLGLLFGGASGIVIGIVLGLNERLGRLLDGLIIAVNAVPRIALAPLLVIWLGIDVTFKAALAAMVVFFLTFMNTYQGVRSVPQSMKNVVRLVGGSEWDVLMKAVWPFCVPWILTGVALAIPYAVIGAVVGEFLSSSRGLGYMIQRSSAFFDTTGTLAAIFLLAAVVIVTNTVLERIQGYLLRWRPGGASQQGSVL